MALGPDELPDDLREAVDRYREEIKVVPEDAELQGLILRRLLEDHPTIYQLSDLARACDLDPTNGLHADAIRCAVDDLVRAGLVVKLSTAYVVIPSATALQFHALPVYL